MAITSDGNLEKLLVYGCSLFLRIIGVGVVHGHSCSRVDRYCQQAVGADFSLVQCRWVCSVATGKCGFSGNQLN